MARRIPKPIAETTPASDTNVKHQEDGMALNTIIAERASHATAESLAAKSRCKTEAYITENYAANGPSANHMISTASQNSTVSHGIEYNNRGQPVVKNQLPPGAQPPGAYMGAPGAQYNRVQPVGFHTLQGLDESATTGTMGSCSLHDNSTRVVHQTDQPSNPPIDGEEGNAHKRIWLFGMTIGVILFATLLACTLGFVIFKGDGGSNANSGMTDNTFGGKTFQAGLPASTASVLAEQDPDSPQYMAMKWLEEEELFFTYPVWRQHQRFGLVTVYFALYHDETEQEWFQHNEDECAWWWNPDKESICDTDGRFLKLFLRLDSRTKKNVNLAGLEAITGGNSTATNQQAPLPLIMPPEIGMVSVQQLILSYIPGTTRLEDMWPKELLLLHNLDRLEVTNSPHIGGTIPTEIGLASTLKYLYLEGSSVTGSLPSEIGQLHQLKELVISENSHLEGTIPTEIGMLSELRLLWILDNPNVTGPIPSEVGLLQELIFLSLRNNGLSSTLPSEMGLIGTLNELRLSNNRFDGTLPVELGHLREMRVFDILDNQDLGGSIPLGLCAIRSDQIKFLVDCERILCCRGYKRG